MGATTFMVAKTFMSIAISVYDNFSNRNLLGHSMHGLATSRELLLLLWVASREA
jgi:hypothetical protein